MKCSNGVLTAPQTSASTLRVKSIKSASVSVALCLHQFFQALPRVSSEATFAAGIPHLLSPSKTCPLSKKGHSGPKKS